MDGPLRPGRCENDTERTIARWLLESHGDVASVERSSGISAKVIREWVQALPERSELRQLDAFVNAAQEVA